MRVLLTGSNGQLGKAIKSLKPEEINLIETTRNDLNLISKEECLHKIEYYKPDWIINSAAFTNVELAEKNYKEALQVNGLAPKFFAECIKSYGGKLLQISTDYVFDGFKNVPYETNDKTNPLNNYGLSKEAGEKNIIKILRENNSAIILRSSWVISPNEHNFLTKMLKLIISRKEVNVVSDQISCPTSTITLARMCWEIVKKEKLIFNNNDLPILHCSDKGFASWYDVALSIYENGKKLGLIKEACLINPVKSSQYNCLANRPLYSLLDCESSYRLLNFKANHWKNELYEIMTKIVY